MRTPGPEPRVAVVITNHDYAAYVAGAIDSALGQVPAPAQVVVVDDGSRDGSRDVIRGYGDRVTALWRDGGGQGPAITAAAGVLDPSVTVVMVLDADDRLRPGALAAVARAFARVPGAARVHFPMRVIDADGAETGGERPHPHLRLPAGDLAPGTLATPFDAPWAGMSGNAFAAHVVRELMPVPEGHRTFPDWYLVHTSSLLGPVARVDAPLADYRLHGRNAYGMGDGRLDLGHVRTTIGYAAATRREIARVARRGGAPDPLPGMASMCDVGNRMISLRAAPSGHPVAGDSRWGLVRQGLRAARRRPDGTLRLKLAFVAWLTSLAVAPGPLVTPIARVFLDPGSRPGRPRPPSLRPRRRR